MRALVLSALLVAGCVPSGQSDRGASAPTPTSCDDVARAVTDLYARAGLVNGNRAQVLDALRIACPGWTSEERACVAGALEDARSPLAAEKCGVIQVELHR